MIDDARFYARLFVRRLPWFALVVAVVTGLGLLVATSLPATYATSARLVVEPEKIPDRLAPTTVRTEGVAHLEIIQQRVLSREALLSLAQRLDVYGEDAPGPDAVVADLRRRVSFEIEAGTPHRRTDPQGATMLHVGFTDRDPVLAAAVANDLVTRVLAEDVDMRTSVARETLEFFQQEADRLEEALAESAARLLDFEERNRDFLPEGREMRALRMDTLRTELSRIERERDALDHERARVIRLHRSLRRQQGATYAAIEPFEFRQLDALSAALMELPADDPGRADLQARIDALQARIDEEGLVRPRGGRRTAFHEYVAEIDAELLAYEARRADIVEQFAELDRARALAPAKIAEAAALERDHDNLRALHEEAMNTRALAETGDAIEALSKGQRIVVIEQASIPREPVSPDRGMLALAAAALGVVLGLATVVLLELRLGVIRRPVDLTRALGITPIAVLPEIVPAPSTQIVATPEPTPPDPAVAAPGTGVPAAPVMPPRRAGGLWVAGLLLACIGAGGAALVALPDLRQQTQALAGELRRTF
jgi:uncharacterized protein involved in exopolysaccharide biosynthesis